ncbi:MAG: hypothetical protein QGD94_11795, partial [Planctomycetia bacterium]|nr:hypothetical protein [Planctomycetia bacterium]
YLKEGNKWRHISRKDGLPTVRLQCLTQDGSILWVGGLGGLSKLDKKTLKVERTHLPMRTHTLKPEYVKSVKDQYDQLVFSITIDGDDLWIGGDAAGAIYNKKTGKMRTLRYWGDWAYDDYFDIVLERGAAYLAASRGVGVMNRKTGNWKIYGTCLSLWANVMGGYALAVDKNYLWIACRAGVARLDKKTGKMGLYTFRGDDPLFRKEQANNSLAIFGTMKVKDGKNKAAVRMWELLPAEAKSGIEKYVAAETESRKDPRYDPAPPSASVLKALNKVMMTPQFMTEGMVEPFRAMKKGEKKLPPRVLSRRQTEKLKKLKAGKLDKLQVAHLKRNILRISMGKMLAPYREPSTPTPLPRRMYNTPKKGVMLYEYFVNPDGTENKPFTDDGIPILGETMADSACWDLVLVGENLWVATNEGLTVMNTRTGKSKVYTVKNGLMHKRVFRVFYDGKNIWACTRGGINIIPAR